MNSTETREAASPAVEETPRTRLRVLSTFHNWTMPFWAAQVDSIDLPEAPRSGALSPLLRALYEIRNGVRLWLRSRAYDAVITDSRASISIYGLLERLPFVRKRRHLMLECLWQRPSGWIGRLLKSLEIRASITAATRAVVYARRERESFQACFGVPAERFVFIPYHTTLMGFPSPTEQEMGLDRYIFAGGESLRDYRTLFAAVDGLPVPVVIALRQLDLVMGLHVPRNVQIITTDHAGFLQWMRNAFVNVVPLVPGSLRSAGQQSFLNAMALGTVTIVTDPEGAGDYVESWVNGILLPSGDPQRLREAIERVYAEPELAARIARNAAHARLQFGTEPVLNAYLDFLNSPDFGDPGCVEFLPERLRSESEPVGAGSYASP